jgi:hypothetical protein
VRRQLDRRVTVDALGPRGARQPIEVRHQRLDQHPRRPDALPPRRIHDQVVLAR